jgi:hypothetical protein
MKKACRILLTVTFWFALVYAIVFFVGGLMGLIFSQPMIDWIIASADTGYGSPDEIALMAQVTIYATFITIMCSSIAMIGPLVVCPITKRKLDKAKSREAMIPLGVLNIFF